MKSYMRLDAAVLAGVTIAAIGMVAVVAMSGEPTATFPDPIEIEAPETAEPVKSFEQAEADFRAAQQVIHTKGLDPTEYKDAQVAYDRALDHMAAIAMAEEDEPVPAPTPDPDPEPTPDPEPEPEVAPEL